MALPLRGRGPRTAGRVPNPGDPRARRTSDGQATGWLQESESVGFDNLGRLYIKDDAPELVALRDRIEKLEAALTAAGLVT